jgi:hypothetical protein
MAVRVREIDQPRLLAIDDLYGVLTALEKAVQGNARLPPRRARHPLRPGNASPHPTREAPHQTRQFLGPE